jgi:hypothetical protein
VALKKPSDLFDKNVEENNIQIIESDNTLREELVKVENLSEQVIQLQQELSQKVIKSDLESLVLSQINTMQENFEYLQNDFRKSNKKDIVEFKEKVSELTEIVGNLVENELPKYRKQVTKNEVVIDEKFNEFIVGIRNEIDSKVDGIAEVIGDNLESFNNQLQETSAEVKKTTVTYNKLSKIVESKVSKENDKLEEYSQVIQSLHTSFVELQESLQEKTSIHQQVIEEKFETISSDLNNKIDSIDEEVNTIKDKVSSDILNIKADVVINEQHIKNVDKYLQENYRDLVELKEEVFGEIEKLPLGNLQENLERLEKKIDYIKETYSKIEPEVIVREVIKEGLLNNPPDTKNSDPLTPLDQKFVTLDQLQEHYRLFINRIQQQLSTIGGGGETRLKYLDDIVGIATNASAYDGKFLKYNHSIGKFVFDNVDISSDSWVDGSNGPYTFGSVGIGTTNPTEKLHVVGIITATSYRGDGSQLTGITAGLSGVSTNTTNQNQFLTYAVSTGSTVGLGVTSLLVYNPSSGNLGIGTTNPTSALTIKNGDISLDDGGTFTTTLQTITATAARVISLPDATGTVALVAGSSGQVIYNSAGIQSGSPSFTFDGTNVSIAGTYYGDGSQLNNIIHPFLLSGM